MTLEDLPVLNQEAAHALLRMIIECAKQQNENHRETGSGGEEERSDA
ncbi:hypothetical protein [Nocardia fusca]|nr:hypothetical protein [Nocardia fusca]